MNINEQKINEVMIDQVGNYAFYNINLGVKIAQFDPNDVAMLARAAKREISANNENAKLKETLSIANEAFHSATKLNDEIRGDVRNAEAHSEALNGKLKDARNDVERFKTLAGEHYDTIQSIREALGMPEDAADDSIAAFAIRQAKEWKRRHDSLCVAIELGAPEAMTEMEILNYARNRLSETD